MDDEETKEILSKDLSEHTHGAPIHENTTELLGGVPDEDVTVSPRDEEEAAVNKLHETDWSMKNSPPKHALPQRPLIDPEGLAGAT